MMWLFYLSLFIAALAVPVGSGFAEYFQEKGRRRARCITLIITLTLIPVGCATAVYCMHWEQHYGGKIAPVLVEKKCRTVLRGTE